MNSLKIFRITVASLPVFVFAYGCASNPNTAAATTGNSAPAETTASSGSSSAGQTSMAVDKVLVPYAKVQAIFTKNCTGCHGVARPRAGITLANYDSVMKGGRKGPIVVAGNPDKSALYGAISGKANLTRMPLNETPLSPGDQTAIKNWISQGCNATP